MAEDSTTTGRVAVVVKRPLSPRADEADGFSFRNWHIVDWLSETNEVLVIYLRRPWSPSMSESLDAGGAVTLNEIDCPVPARGPWPARTWRVRAIIRDLLPRTVRERWESEMYDQVNDWKADVVIALLDSTPRDVVRLAQHHRVIMFAEEDFSILPTSHGQPSRHSRTVAAFEQWANRRYIRSLKGDVVVISPNEEPWARRTFPNSHVYVVPHFIDLRYWQRPAADEEAVHSDVFVVGAMDRSRNAEGLVAILDEVGRQYSDEALPIVSVVSRDAPHPALADCRYPRLRFAGAVDDIRPHYAGATLTLVPSFLVTGAKTTILQGWAMQTPVVATEPAAESIGGTHGRNLLASSTPKGVASELMRLLGTADLRSELVRNGRATVEQLHTPAGAMARLAAVISDVSKQCQGPQAGRR